MFEWDSLSWSYPTRYLWVVKSTTENMILVALRINLWISIVHINTNVYQNYGWVLVSFWFFLYPGQKNEMVLQPITVYCRWYIQSVVVKGRAVCLTELAVQCNQHVWKIWLWVFTYRVCFIVGIICSFRIKKNPIFSNDAPPAAKNSEILIITALLSEYFFRCYLFEKFYLLQLYYYITVINYSTFWHPALHNSVFTANTQCPQCSFISTCLVTESERYSIKAHLSSAYLYKPPVSLFFHIIWDGTQSKS